MGTLKQTDVVAGDWKSLEELRLDGDEVCLLLCQLLIFAFGISFSVESLVK